MANIPVEGKRIIFMIDTSNTGSNPDLVVCLTSSSFERSANVIDASSKCGTYKMNGIKERTINIEGNVIFNPDGTALSEGELNDLFENDTKFSWLFGPETPVDGDQWYTGSDAIISNLTITAPQNGALTFSGTVQLNGVPVRHTEGS